MVSRVLILKDQVPFAKLPEDMLTSLPDDSFGNELILQVSSALSHMGSSSFDVVVVDPALLDNRGKALFKQLFTLVRDSPLMIINELGNEGLVIEPVLHSGHKTLQNNHARQSFIARSLNRIEFYKQIEETLFIEKSRAETTLNAISDAVITTDIDGRVDYLNKAAEQLTGWIKEDALRRSMRLLQSVQRSCPIILLLQYVHVLIFICSRSKNIPPKWHTRSYCSGGFPCLRAGQKRAKAGFTLTP